MIRGACQTVAPPSGARGTRATLGSCLTAQESVRVTPTNLPKRLWISQPGELKIANLPLRVVRTLRPSHLDGWAASRVVKREPRHCRRGSAARLPEKPLKRGTVKNLEWAIVADASKPEWPPLLPLGFHGLDAAARKRLCVDRFPESVTRPRILANLETLIVAVNRQAIAGHIWIDGSFLTEKLNPDDVDIALVVPRATVLAFSRAQRLFFDELSDKKLYDQYKLDSYGIALDVGTDVGDYTLAYWLRQFGFSRDDVPKGIVRISVPFVVVP
jgi:hypothetical protein